MKKMITNESWQHSANHRYSKENYRKINYNSSSESESYRPSNYKNKFISCYSNPQMPVLPKKISRRNHHLNSIQSNNFLSPRNNMMNRRSQNDSLGLPANFQSRNDNSNTLMNHQMMLENQLNSKINSIEEKVRNLEKQSLRMEAINEVFFKILPSVTKDSLSTKDPSFNNIQIKKANRRSLWLNAQTIHKNEVASLDDEITNLKGEILNRFARLNRKQELQMEGIRYLLKKSGMNPQLFDRSNSLY